jgi:hypothetical protein
MAVGSTFLATNGSRPLRLTADFWQERNFVLRNCVRRHLAGKSAYSAQAQGLWLHRSKRMIPLFFKTIGIDIIISFHVKKV